MRICIVGASGHYYGVLEALKDEKDAQVAGASPGPAGEDVNSLHNAASEFGYNPQRFDNYMEMFDEIKPDIAVINPYFSDNAATAVEALNRGVHVYMEKPVATTLEGLESVKEACRKSGASLAAMLEMRYSPWFFTAWRAVQDGAIGSVRLMNAQKSYKLGTRGEHFKNRSTYGGTIPWVGSHAIDWLHWFSGERFESVHASHSTCFNHGHGELETTAVCNFTMTNEVFATVSIDYLRPQNVSGHGDDRLRVVGTNGIVEVRGEKAYIISDNDTSMYELELLPERNIFSDFLWQVQGQGKCLVSAEDSFYTTEACLKARLSADEKNVVYF